MTEPRDSNNSEETNFDERAALYWRANIGLLVKLLIIWFLVSFGFGILWVDYLNQFNLFGMKLGFWFAQQGAIYVFVMLIFAYVVLIKRIEKRFGIDDNNNK